MNVKSSEDGTPRPQELLEEILLRYPDALYWAERFRQDKGTEPVGDWPEWCFLPLAAPYAIVSRGGRLDPQLVGDVGALGALLAWRVRKDIFRVDPDVFIGAWNAPLAEDMPVEMLFDLPGRCPYVEVPDDVELPGRFLGLRGFFAHLEWDVNEHHPELRFLLDTEWGPLVAFLDLTAPTLEGCVRSGFEGFAKNLEDPVAREMCESLMGKEAAESVFRDAAEDLESTIRRHAEIMEPLVSVVLRLCASGFEITAADGSGRGLEDSELHRAGQGGTELAAAPGVSEWRVGRSPAGAGGARPGGGASSAVDVEARNLVREAVGDHMLVTGKSYPEPLPEELERWYCYTLDGGHSIAVVTEHHYGPDIDPAHFLVPAPVKSVLKAGHRTSRAERLVVADLAYDPGLGLLPDHDDHEY